MSWSGDWCTEEDMRPTFEDEYEDSDRWREYWWEVQRDNEDLEDE